MNHLRRHWPPLFALTVAILFVVLGPRWLAVFWPIALAALFILCLWLLSLRSH